VIGTLLIREPGHLEKKYDFVLRQIVRLNTHFKTHLLFVLLGSGVAPVQHHFLGEQTILRSIDSRLPGHTQLGDFSTRHALAQSGHLRTGLSVVKSIQLETPEKNIKIIIKSSFYED